MLLKSPNKLDFDFVVNSVIPPARDIAKRVLFLAEERPKEFSENGLVADLQKSWSKMHFLRTVEDSGAIAPLRDPKQSLAKRTLVAMSSVKCRQFCICFPCFFRIV